MENFDNEQWRDIAGYEGVYQVSDLGRVRSRKSGEWKVMKQGKVGAGYLSVMLSKNNKAKRFYVHRLVANAFIPNNDDSKNEINHRNEDKTENKVSNLEYCDRSYNLRYNDLHHRRITKIDKIKDLYNPDLTYEQNLEIFKANGIECCYGTIWKLRKDLKLKRFRRNWKRDRIKDLYDPNLSINENLKVFKEQGIECCKVTLWYLRRDLKLIQPHQKYKRDKVKSLYDPNLSVKQNLEIFKANGIDCSERTVYRLRKDITK